MARHPDVSLILAHAGGVLAVLAPRILVLGPMEWVPDPADGITYEGVRQPWADSTATQRSPARTAPWWPC